MNVIDTPDAEIKQLFELLHSEVENLSYSESSLIELGAIKLKAERIAKNIKKRQYRVFCLNEIRQLDTDEFHDMYKNPSENTFAAAQFELMLILKDCRNGFLNGF